MFFVRRRGSEEGLGARLIEVVVKGPGFGLPQCWSCSWRWRSQGVRAPSPPSPLPSSVATTKDDHARRPKRPTHRLNRYRRRLNRGQPTWGFRLLSSNQLLFLCSGRRTQSGRYWLYLVKSEACVGRGARSDGSVVVLLRRQKVPKCLTQAKAISIDGLCSDELEYDRRLQTTARAVDFLKHDLCWPAQGSLLPYQANTLC